MNRHREPISIAPLRRVIVYVVVSPLVVIPDVFSLFWRFSWRIGHTPISDGTVPDIRSRIEHRIQLLVHSLPEPSVVVTGYGVFFRVTNVLCRLVDFANAELWILVKVTTLVPDAPAICPMLRGLITPPLIPRIRCVIKLHAFFVFGVAQTQSFWSGVDVPCFPLSTRFVRRVKVRVSCVSPAPIVGDGGLPVTRVRCFLLVRAELKRVRVVHFPSVFHPCWNSVFLECVSNCLAFDYFSS